MQLTFYGAVESVTGSCFLLETSKGRLLIDCGMHQGERMCARKTVEPLPFDAKSLSAVLVTHAHFDHTGRLPQLIQEGFLGQIYMTAPTKGITEIILEDSLGIMRENARKCGDVVPFNEEDIRVAMAHSQGVNYHTEFEPLSGIRVTFNDAGHILGSSFISIDVPGHETATGEAMRLIFSGDIGNDNVPILPDTEAIAHADIVICESTYGGKTHDPVEERGQHLAEFVKEVLHRGGTLMIPAFSVERTQELLYELDLLLAAKAIPQVPIYLDSPLAIRATEIYRQYKSYLKFDHPMLPGGDFFTFQGLHETLSQNESLMIDNDHRPKIIVAGNGMMSGGRILRHMQNYLSDKKSGLLIIGYQAQFTMGRKILEGAKQVVLHGKKVSVLATIKTIEAFSAHGDQTKLAKWLHPTTGAIPRVFLTHGDPSTKLKFQTYLAEKGVSDVIIPKLNEVFEL